MRIGEVIGRVTLSRAHESLKSPRFLVTLPMTREALTDGSTSRGEEVIVYDSLGAGPGALIGFGEGREAANPFGKVRVPVDAYCACLLDRVDVGSPANRHR